MADSQAVFNNVALAGTIKSLVAFSEERLTTYHLTWSGTPTATLTLEVNTLPDTDYRAAVAAAGSEAANTTGWIAHDLRAGNMNPHISAATHALGGAAGTLFFYLPPGAYRTRLSVATSAGSGNITAYRRHIRQ